jgi:hypothetical protein
LFVVAESVEEIEDREFSGFVGVVTGRKEHAVVDGMSEDFAGEGIALDAAGGRGGGKDREKIESRKEKKADSSLRSR